MIKVGSTVVLPYEKNLVLKALNSNQTSPGPLVKRFEEKFAQIHNLKHAAFVSSGTDALKIALVALKEKYGWKDGDVVLVPSTTFVATINVVLQVGLKPLLVDVGMHGYMMNPYNILRRYDTTGSGKMDPEIKCILVAHLFGQPAEMDRILEIAKKYNLRVVEDSCETMFVKYRGKMVGGFGDISCFSTYACHLLSTGVGGFACTNDDELNTLIRSYANHGRDPAYIPNYSKPKSLDEFIEKHFKYDRIGFSSRGTEMQAALGLGQLKLWKQNLRRRQYNAHYLTKHLEMWLNDLQLPYPMPDREHAYMMYPIVIKEGSKAKKKDLMLHLGKAGIEARDMLPILKQPCYLGLLDTHTYCVSQHIDTHGFYIGCHPELTDKDLHTIVREFDKYFNALDKK